VSYSWWRSTLLLAALPAPAEGRTARPSVAFYGKPVPVAELRHFDWAAVQPEHLDDAGLPSTAWAASNLPIVSPDIHDAVTLPSQCQESIMPLARARRRRS
jgi:hypothetical protein